MSNKNIDEKLRSALEAVKDTDLDKTLGELGAISKLEISSGKVIVELNLTQPVSKSFDIIIENCKKSITQIANDLVPEIILTTNEIDYSERAFLKGVKNIIAVSSGKGGVGKSSIAANLAVALSFSGAKVGVLDADVYGPSQPTMFGVKDAVLSAYEDETGKAYALPVEKFGIKIASMGFMMKREEAAIIRGPMLAGYFTMLFEQIDWGKLDYLIIDLPPGTGDIQLTMTQRLPLTGAVIVTTPQEISLADVRRSIAMFQKVDVDILGIIENMSYFVPPDMPDKKYYIFGEGGGKNIAEENGLKFLGEVPLDMLLRDAGDKGEPAALKPGNNPIKENMIKISNDLLIEMRKINYRKLSENVQISI